MNVAVCAGGSTCALPGCNRPVEAGRFTCCRSHGQRLRRHIEIKQRKACEILDAALGIAGHPKSMVRAVECAERVLRERRRKVNGHVIFGLLLHMSDISGVEFYDGERGGFDSPEEIEKVLRALHK